MLKRHYKRAVRLPIVQSRLEDSNSARTYSPALSLGWQPTGNTSTFRVGPRDCDTPPFALINVLRAPKPPHITSGDGDTPWCRFPAKTRRSELPFPHRISRRFCSVCIKNGFLGDRSYRNDRLYGYFTVADRPVISRHRGISTRENARSFLRRECYSRLHVLTYCGGATMLV